VNAFENQSEYGCHPACEHRADAARPRSRERCALVAFDWVAMLMMPARMSRFRVSLIRVEARIAAAPPKLTTLTCPHRTGSSMGRTLRSLALAAIAASYVQAFAPAALPQVAGIRPAALRAGAAAVSMQEEASPVVSRRGLLSGALASAVLVGGGSSASADMLKAACTLQSCPEPPGGAYKTDTLQINKGKFTGQGYQFKRPTEDYFKRVQVFDRVTARPGSVLLRDKKNPDTAIFSNVEQIKNADYTWKPTIVEVIFEVSTECHLMSIVGVHSKAPTERG